MNKTIPAYDIGAVLAASPESVGATITVDMAVERGLHRQHDVGFLHGYPKDGFAADPERRAWMEALQPRNWRTWVTPEPLETKYNGFDQYEGLRAVGVQTIQASCSCYSIFKRGVRTQTIDEFRADCRELAQRAQREGKQFQYDVVNEGNLGDKQWVEFWIAGAQQVRAVIPDAMLIGPSHVNTAGIDFGDFLDRTHAAGIYPDIIAYHEFRGPTRIEWEVARIRDHAKAKGYPERPVIINEFWPSEQDTDLPASPACLIAYMAAGQRAGVSMNYAVNNCNDTLDHLLTVRMEGSKRILQRNSLYWVHRAFVEMQGRSCQVETSDKTIADGFGSWDAERRRLTLLIGSPFKSTPGTVQVQVHHLPNTLPLHAGLVLARIRKLQHLPSHDSAGFAVPVTVAAVVNDGTASFTIALERFQACELVIEPGLALSAAPQSGIAYQIRNCGSGQSFNVRGSSLLSGFGVEQFPHVSSAASMRWLGTRDENGWWTFAVEHSGHMLTAAIDRAPDDDPVVQRPADGSAGQRWRIEAHGPDGWRIVSALGGCLSIEGGYQSHGAAVVVEPLVDSLMQRWQLVPAETAPAQ